MCDKANGILHYNPKNVNLSQQQVTPFLIIFDAPVETAYTLCSVVGIFNNQLYTHRIIVLAKTQSGDPVNYTVG